MKKNFYRVVMMFAMFVAATTVSFAQPITKAQTKELFKANSQSAGALSSMTSNMSNSKSIPSEKKEKLMSYLFSDQFLDDFVESVYPYYSKHLTQKDYEYLMAKYQSEQGKTAISHMQEVAKTLDDSSTVTVMQDVIKSVFTGKEITQVAYTCPDSYKEKWNEYFKNSGEDKMISGIVDYSREMINKMLSAHPMFKNADSDNGHMNAIVNRLNEALTAITGNLKVIMCNNSYGTLTDDDLEFFKKINDSEAGKHFLASNDETSENIKGLLEMFTTKISEQLK